MQKNNKKIVCVGGGTGTSVVLSGLKDCPIDLTAVVTMADDGGSNKIVRDEFGLLPTSDMRQCFVVLAEDKNDPEQVLRKLFTYRFNKGNGIRGMTFGNLFMAALTDILGSQIEAIKKTGEILKTKGRVLPVTLSDSRLVAIYENREKIKGEHFIDEPRHDGNLKIEKIYLEPESYVYPDAARAILEADLVVVGPGDLYTSIVPNLVVNGMREAIKKTDAKVAYILNLMTKYGQTAGFTAKDHVEALEKYLGNNLDFVLINSGSVPSVLLKKYETIKEFPVFDDLNDAYFKVIRSDFLSEKTVKKVAGDLLKRSLIRHDSKKLAKSLMSLIK